MHKGNIIARQGVMNDVEFLLNHAPNVSNQLLHGGTYSGLHSGRVSNFETRSRVDSPDCLAEGLGRDRTRIDTDAANQALFFHYRHFRSLINPEASSELSLH